MRDVNNPLLREKATELMTEKDRVNQYRYSEGDPVALEKEQVKYRLSKTQNFDMSEKLSGEQNRMLYDQVRPSYFVDKRETPLFDSPTKRITNAAGDDITMNKSLDSYSYSKKQTTKGMLDIWL